jgi:hypothetical protein
MSAKRRKPRRQKKPPVSGDPPESRTAELLTIAWTVSVTAVVFADLMAAGAHFLARRNSAIEVLAPLAGLPLLSAAAMGVVSLILLALVWRQRRLKPPQGYVAFALIVAAAPIAAAILKVLS